MGGVMKYFLSLFVILLITASGFNAWSNSTQMLNFEYKAYWGGLVIAEINSETILNSSNYEIRASYHSRGLAKIIGKMENYTMSRGVSYKNGVYQPEYYESSGNFGKFNYKNQVTFDPKTLEVINLVQNFELRSGTEYIPIEDNEKYGVDPMTTFLNRVMNSNFADNYSEEVKSRQFGGMFVSEQSFLCDEQKVFNYNKRSAFQGMAYGCIIDGKNISGDIKNMDPEKKIRKGRERDDQNNRIFFGKMTGFEGTIPVYTEFPLGWGMVRIYLSDFKQTTVNE
tara:strand:+ start:1582 stop:2427 length:846 start_codon:yes stop_codon:yes gene_type:complete